MSLPAPKTYHLSLHDGDTEIAVDVVHYSISEGMVFWTNVDRTVEAVNLSNVSYIRIVPPPLEEPS